MILHKLILQKWYFSIINYIALLVIEIVFHGKQLNNLFYFFILELRKHVYTLINSQYTFDSPSP
jgi:hypothetical protein